MRRYFERLYKREWLLPFSIAAGATPLGATPLGATPLGAIPRGNDMVVPTSLGRILPS